MIQGAAQELVTGDPFDLATDVGPVIDTEAFDGIQQQLARLHLEAKPLMPHASTFRHRERSAAIHGSEPQEKSWTAAACDLAVTKECAPNGNPSVANLIAPQAFEIEQIADMKQEIFGPVLHIVRWSGDPLAVIEQINALGYGLTIGIQTRIDSRAQALARASHIGNVYINRNQIGAVVGVQPFGGEGLSGTGPKAGGPHYLYRFCAEQTLTVNTTAAGGNAALLAG
jgi:RHH-type proline utilization regulon transcriptional repressor/proline dehydrogenase/delta 1-pyrroline-5-carboxylate dehydrogenase